MIQIICIKTKFLNCSVLLGDVCRIIDGHWIASVHLNIAMSDGRVKLGTYGKQLTLLLIFLGESNLDQICIFF